jgi:hypothetical protein
MVIWFFFFQKWYKGWKKPRIKENCQRMDDNYYSHFEHQNLLESWNKGEWREVSL